MNLYPPPLSKNGAHTDEHIKQKHLIEFRYWNESLLLYSSYKYWIYKTKNHVYLKFCKTSRS